MSQKRYNTQFKLELHGRLLKLLCKGYVETVSCAFPNFNRARSPPDKILK